MKRYVKSLASFIFENFTGEQPCDTSKMPRGLVLYTQSNTQAGGTTPTGQSNSFDNTTAQLSEEDLYQMACKLGFRTDNNSNFQTDSLAWAQKNSPETVKEMETKFGPTAAGTYVDGLLGARTMFLINLIKKKIPPPAQTTETVQPNQAYTVNVRGDEANGLGAYYFLKNAQDYQTVLNSTTGLYSSGQAQGAQGQITFDMNHDVFLQRIQGLKNGQQLLQILGTPYLRDKNNPNQFVPKTGAGNAVASQNGQFGSNTGYHNGSEQLPAQTKTTSVPPKP